MVVKATTVRPRQRVRHRRRHNHTNLYSDCSLREQNKQLNDNKPVLRVRAQSVAYLVDSQWVSASCKEPLHDKSVALLGRLEERCLAVLHINERASESAREGGVSEWC